MRVRVTSSRNHHEPADDQWSPTFFSWGMAQRPLRKLDSRKRSTSARHVRLRRQPAAGRNVHSALAVACRWKVVVAAPVKLSFPPSRSVRASSELPSQRRPGMPLSDPRAGSLQPGRIEAMVKDTVAD